MSINIEIIPLINKKPEWREIKNYIIENVSDSRKRILLANGIALLDMKLNSCVGDFDVIKNDRGYSVLCANSETLSILVIDKSEADDNKEYIEDLGCNLSDQEKINLLEKWKNVPFTYLISTGANRTPKEVELMGIVSAAFAYVSDGVGVISLNKFFTLEKGIYKPGDLLNVRMLSR